jgi:hypothetical protein
MVNKYLEEYLVGLGFDYKPDQGKQFIKQLDDIEKKTKTTEKTGKASEDQAKKEQKNRNKKIEDGKKELDIMRGMEQTGSRIGRIFGEIARGNPFGALAAGIQGTGSFLNFIKSLGTSNTIQFGSTLFNNPLFRGRGGQATQATQAAQVGQAAQAAQTAQAAQAATRAAKGIQAGMAGGGAAAAGAGAVGEGAGALAGVGVAAGVAAAVVALVALIAAAVVKTEQFGEAISKVNINIETMARKMWISDEQAWKLQNTLAAMGKSVGDLNDIALNPTLRSQFEALQKYQKTTMLLPGDFAEVNKKWADSVGLANNELKMSTQYMALLIGYDVEKYLVEPFSKALHWLNGIVLDIDHLLGLPTGKGVSADAQSKQAQVAGITQFSSNGALFAPHNASYSSSANNVQVNINPKVVVHTNASDAQGVAAEVGRTVGSPNIYTAAIASVQSVFR